MSSRILIIEDETSIAELEKDYLELSGFEVELEEQGDVGLERALNEDFEKKYRHLLFLTGCFREWMALRSEGVIASPRIHRSS